MPHCQVKVFPIASFSDACPVQSKAVRFCFFLRCVRICRNASWIRKECIYGYNTCALLVCHFQRGTEGVLLTYFSSTRFASKGTRSAVPSEHRLKSRDWLERRTKLITVAPGRKQKDLTPSSRDNEGYVSYFVCILFYWK